MSISGSWRKIPAALFFLVWTVLATAEDKAARPLDLTHISDEYFATAVIYPARLMKSAALKDLPLSEAATWVEARLGIDPRQLEQAIVLVPTGPRPVPVAAILRFNAPHSVEKTLAQIAGKLNYGELAPAEHAGKKYFRCTGRVQAAGYAADEKTLIVGSESCVQTMMTTKSAQSPLLERLRNLDARDDFSLAVMTETLTTRFEELRFDGSESLAFDFAFEILRRCKSVILTLGPDASRLSCQLEAKDAATDEFLHELLRGSAAFVKALLPVWQRHLQRKSAVSPRLIAELGRMSEPMLQRVAVRRDGNRLTITVQIPVEYPNLVLAIIESIYERESLRNLRQLAITMHQHHDVCGRFPAHATYDKDGKPLLSWRVHVLPFLGARELHAHFRLNEPWDSEHNKKLVPLMPRVLQNPGRTLPPGKTCYLVPITDDEKYRTVFARGTGKKGEVNDGMVTTFANITDGSAFTLMIVEAAPEKAVIWTKPDDWEFDPKKPREGLFGMRRHLLLAHADASVTPVRKEVPDEVLRAVFGCSDGDPLTLGRFRVGVREDEQP
jgi:hypothetical protein